MAQIKKRFIAPNAIDGSKLRLLNNEAIRALAADGSDVDVMKIDVNSVLQFLRTPQVSQDPSSGNDITRKSYTDGYTNSAVASEAALRSSADSALQAAIDALSLDSLTDVEMSSPAAGDMLRYIDGKWKKESPADERQTSSGGGGSTQTISFLDATEGTLDSQFSIDNWSSNSEKVGQTFGGVSGQLTSFTWVLRRPETVVSGSLKVLIYEYNSATKQPTGNVLATSDTISKNTLPQSVDTNVQFVFSSPATLDSAKKYVAFIAAENSPSSGMYDVVVYRSWYDFNGYEKIYFNTAEWSYANSSFRHIYTVQTGGGASSPVGNLIIQSNADGFLDESFLQYNVNFGGNQLSGVSAPTAGTDAANKEWVEGQVAAEQSARQSAISSEASTRAAADTALDARLDVLEADATTKAYVDSADAGLQSQINTEKGRVDAILSASSADKDSFAEIVQLINSVDTENDSAFASYVLSNNAALAQEVSERQTGDTTLQGNIDAEEARALAAEGVLQAAISQEVSDRQDAVSAEQTRAQTAEASLQDAIDQEISDRQAAVSNEQSARESADSAFDARLDVLEADPTTKTYVDEADQDLQDQIDALQISTGGDVAAEVLARTAADAALDARLDVIEGSDTTEGSVAKAEKDAKDHADSIVASEQAAREAADTSLQNQINDILNNTDASALDSLSEIVTAFQEADSDLTAAITSVLGTHTSELNTEVAAREAADAALQSNIDAEETAREAADAAEAAARAAELPRHAKFATTLTSTDVMNGYVDLDHVALGNSVHVFIDRLACHEDTDYILSTVNGKTRVTFSAGFMSSGEAPEAGDLFRCGYAYKNSDQSSV